MENDSGELESDVNEKLGSSGVERARESIDPSSAERGGAAATAVAPADAPIVFLETPAENAATPATFSVLFGDGPEPREAKEAKQAEAKPGTFQGFLAKLGKAVEEAMTLEVRTYVSTNVGATARADRETLAREGDLRAFTRVMLNGNIDAIVPERDGAVDTTLWGVHQELVKQAQEARAETIKTVLSSLSGLVKL